MLAADAGAEAPCYPTCAVADSRAKIPASANHCVGDTPMTDKIQIEIDAKWARRVKSPLFWVISALTGVSASFAPLFLYQAGQGRFANAASWLVPVCFVVIYAVPLFYIRLGRDVIAAIQQQGNPRPSSALSKAPRNLSLPTRICSLLGGPAYLITNAWVFSEVDSTSIWFTLPVISVGALAIMAVLAILSQKLNRLDQPASRFCGVNRLPHRRPNLYLSGRNPLVFRRRAIARPRCDASSHPPSGAIHAGLLDRVHDHRAPEPGRGDHVAGNDVTPTSRRDPADRADAAHEQRPQIRRITRIIVTAGSS